MKLGEKIRYLREVEGSLRGLGRPMTQLELVRALREELGKGRGSTKGASISQSYLSQIENGARPHMTQSSRALLAKFFKVHPGFLVDDPDGYHAELTSDLRTTEGQIDVWLLQGSEKFASDPEVSDVLIKAAREKDTRRCSPVAGRDSRHAGTGRTSARGAAARARGRQRQSLGAAALRTEMGKGGESDDARTRFDWADFYLICFAVGFCFSFFSFVFGSSRFGRLHLPHFHGHAHFPAAHGPVVHGPMTHAPVAGAHAPVRPTDPRPRATRMRVTRCTAAFRRSTSSR